MNEPLEVLYEDAHCLAVSKPAGLLTQPAGPRTEASLEDAVRLHLSPAHPNAVYLGTVHRLDRPVSGVIVWAKTPKAARRLARQFETRHARKHYWALVEGDACARIPSTGRWEDWLTPPDPLGVVRVVASEMPRARLAVTCYEVGPASALPEGTSWLRLWPESGRTHQLRVQAAARGLPVIGDVLYGAVRPFPQGIALHARALRIGHPTLNTEMTWTAPVPASWPEAGAALPELAAFDRP
ncbi:MAG: RluA family pseudouridine synthase [Isosphaeraceae bacterium]|nr:RluA family pseudouridine synthase [Isosphaeraceae bacterium]